jgi:hypothetical protein
VIAATLAGAAAAITVGMWPANVAWVPAWTAVSVLYVVCALALWRGRDWARAFSLGVAGWGLGAWLQGCVALGLTPLTITATLGHALLFGLVAISRDGLPPRHRWSLTLASASLPSAIAFGLAPQQSLPVALLCAGGGLALVAGAVGVARGKTRGLIIGLVAAPAIAGSVLVTPGRSWLLHPHAILPHGSPVMMDVLGICAAALAIAAILPFAGPIRRFLGA